MTLNQLRALQRAKTKEAGGYWKVTEGDWWQNKISRAIVRAFRRERGGAFLGSVNRPTTEKGTPYSLTEYRRGMVYNFGASFVVPVNDERLLELLREREAAPYEGTKRDAARIAAIYDRIEELKGFHLRWV